MLARRPCCVCWRAACAPPLAPDLTVHDHVLLIATTWFETSFEVQDAADRVLEEFHLAALATRFPHELSSGQTQLLGLALIFVRPFDVLLLDEPEQRLDPDRVVVLAEALVSRRRAGATCIIATHSEALATLVANQTIVLGDPQ